MTWPSFVTRMTFCGINSNDRLLKVPIWIKGEEEMDIIGSRSEPSRRNEEFMAKIRSQQTDIEFCFQSLQRSYERATSKEFIPGNSLYSTECISNSPEAATQRQQSDDFAADSNFVGSIPDSPKKCTTSQGAEVKCDEEEDEIANSSSDSQSKVSFSDTCSFDIKPSIDSIPKEESRPKKLSLSDLGDDNICEEENNEMQEQLSPQLSENCKFSFDDDVEEDSKLSADALPTSDASI